MAAKPKLTQEEWEAVRKHWESDPRDGYAWLVEELGLQVSGPGVRKTALRDGWAKASTQGGDTPSQPVAPARAKSSTKGAGKVFMVSENHQPKASETMPETIEVASGERVEPGEGRRGPGRPTMYQDEYSEQAYKLCLLGATDAEMADFFDVGEATINRWKISQPEFRESIKRGKAVADAAVAESLYLRARGYSHPDVHITNYQGDITVTDIVKYYPPDTRAAAIWLNNRQPKKWRANVDPPPQVNINVFPAREVLDDLYNRALQEAEVIEAELVDGRMERLGIDLAESDDTDG